MPQNTQLADLSRPQLIEELSTLESLFSDMQTNLPKEPAAKKLSADEKKSRLAKARRELLKANSQLVKLESSFSDALGLTFLEPDEVEEVNEVVALRKQATDDYYRAVKLEKNFAKIVREFGQGLKGQLREKIDTLSNRTSSVKKGLFRLYWDLPDLGMTVAEWAGMSVVQRRAVRPSGRPGMPLECEITQTRELMESLMGEVALYSDGKIKTLEEALNGVELSNRGRPQLSDIAKLERTATRLKRDLERLDPKDFPAEGAVATGPRPADTYQQRVDRITAQIAELEDKIRIEEAELEGVAVYRRELEKQRGKHRDLVNMESKTSGAEQASLLLEILKNEVQQEETVMMIRKLDETATETLTHRVNPKETRDRLARLEMNGRLDEAQQLLLAEIKQSLFNKKAARAR